MGDVEEKKNLGEIAKIFVNYRNVCIAHKYHKPEKGRYLTKDEYKKYGVSSSEGIQAWEAVKKLTGTEMVIEWAEVKDLSRVATAARAGANAAQTAWNEMGSRGSWKKDELETPLEGKLWTLQRLAEENPSDAKEILGSKKSKIKLRSQSVSNPSRAKSDESDLKGSNSDESEGEEEEEGSAVEKQLSVMREAMREQARQSQQEREERRLEREERKEELRLRLEAEQKRLEVEERRRKEELEERKAEKAREEARFQKMLEMMCGKLQTTANMNPQIVRNLEDEFERGASPTNAENARSEENGISANGKNRENQNTEKVNSGSINSDNESVTSSQNQREIEYEKDEYWPVPDDCIPVQKMSKETKESVDKPMPFKGEKENWTQFKFSFEMYLSKMQATTKKRQLMLLRQNLAGMENQILNTNIESVGEEGISPKKYWKELEIRFGRTAYVPHELDPQKYLESFAWDGRRTTFAAFCREVEIRTRKWCPAGNAKIMVGALIKEHVPKELKIKILGRDTAMHRVTPWMNSDVLIEEVETIFEEYMTTCQEIPWAETWPYYHSRKDETTVIPVKKKEDRLNQLLKDHWTARSQNYQGYGVGYREGYNPQINSPNRGRFDGQQSSYGTRGTYNNGIYVPGNVNGRPDYYGTPSRNNRGSYGFNQSRNWNPNYRNNGDNWNNGQTNNGGINVQQNTNGQANTGQSVNGQPSGQNATQQNGQPSRQNNNQQNNQASSLSQSSTQNNQQSNGQRNTVHSSNAEQAAVNYIANYEDESSGAEEYAMFIQKAAEKAVRNPSRMMTTAVDISGTRVEALLDTGASIVAVSRSLANKLAGKPQNRSLRAAAEGSRSEKKKTEMKIQSDIEGKIPKISIKQSKDPKTIQAANQNREGMAWILSEVLDGVVISVRGRRIELSPWIFEDGAIPYEAILGVPALVLLGFGFTLPDGEEILKTEEAKKAKLFTKKASINPERKGTYPRDGRRVPKIGDAPSGSRMMRDRQRRECFFMRESPERREMHGPDDREGCEILQNLKDLDVLNCQSEDILKFSETTGENQTMDRKELDRVFMNSLRKMQWNDYVGKETTSLLMKELEELKVEAAPSSSATGSSSRHQRHHHHPSASSSSHSAAATTTQGAHHHHQRSILTSPSGGQSSRDRSYREISRKTPTGRYYDDPSQVIHTSSDEEKPSRSIDKPSESHNVARTILQTIRRTKGGKSKSPAAPLLGSSRQLRKPFKSTNGGPSLVPGGKIDQEESSIGNSRFGRSNNHQASTLTNGHATEEEIQEIYASSHGTNIVTRSARHLKEKLILDLKGNFDSSSPQLKTGQLPKPKPKGHSEPNHHHITSNGGRHISHPSEPIHNYFEEGLDDLESAESASGVSSGVSHTKAGGTNGTKQSEHDLIAFNSALLIGDPGDSREIRGIDSSHSNSPKKLSTFGTRPQQKPSRQDINSNRSLQLIAQSSKEEEDEETKVIRTGGVVESPPLAGDERYSSESPRAGTATKSGVAIYSKIERRDKRETSSHENEARSSASYQRQSWGGSTEVIGSGTMHESSSSNRSGHGIMESGGSSDDDGTHVPASDPMASNPRLAPIMSSSASQRLPPLSSNSAEASGSNSNSPRKNPTSNDHHPPHRSPNRPGSSERHSYHSPNLYHHRNRMSSAGEVPAGVALPACCVTTTPGTDNFLEFRRRFSTSYRLKIPNLKNPVDACLLPNDCIAIADYDNGFIIINPSGEVVKHFTPLVDGKNACGVACSMFDSEFRLLVLVYKEGAWAIQIYNWCFELVQSIPCPQDHQIETWALRKIVLGDSITSSSRNASSSRVSSGDEPGTSGCTTPAQVTPAIYLLASGETKSVIWARDLGSSAVPDGDWLMVLSETSRRGPYNDFFVRYREAVAELRFLLCDAKKAQLSTVVLDPALQLIDSQVIKMKRVKGQEWIVQGPKLAAWDEHGDILVYDGSGKLFLFDGDSFKCKKIVADLGRGEVSALAVRDGWCYVLCRYRLCVEAFLYKEFAETTL